MLGLETTIHLPWHSIPNAFKPISRRSRTFTWNRTLAATTMGSGRKSSS
jgi:hypothetical protein